jgi:enamine deaminase RidA (YjgF/YER057c/UK114 family)
MTDETEPELFVTDPTALNRDPGHASPHRSINPESLGKPWGFSHVVVPAGGRTIYLAGQTAHGPDDEIPADLVEQFDRACAHVVTALAAAGGSPEHLVSVQIFTTALKTYLSVSKEIGEAWRRHFGKHYPAAALVGVRSLVGGARVEIMGVAVVPEPASGG